MAITSPGVGVRAFAARTVVVLLGSIVLALVLAGRASTADNYIVADIVPLSTLNAGWNGGALNASGWVAGGQGSSSRRAFLYDNASVRDLGTFDGLGESVANGINATGKVVGWAHTSGGANQAFVYDGIAKSNLGSLKKNTFSAAYDINDANTVVGTSTVNGGTTHAFLHDTRMRDLGVLPGRAYSSAEAINDSGQATGTSWNVSNGVTDERAFLYSGSSMQDIGTLGGSGARAWDINAAGSVAGSSQAISGSWHAFVREGGIMRDLTPAALSATGYAINNRGEVVGESDGKAFLYSDGHYIDLNRMLPDSSGWMLVRAYDINDSGQIVGEGTLQGAKRAFRLTLTLLGRFAPDLRYDTQEAYRADSAAELTDNFLSGQYSNALKDEDDVVLAAADPSLPQEDLNLAFLGNVYTNGQPALSTHKIDEANSYEVDYQRLHAFDSYSDRVYGRIVTYPDGERILQYWFFYYYNPKTYFLRGAHEGDWEMIQVLLQANGNASETVYAQHDDAEVCAWQYVEKNASGHPIVYVGEGSHASYFEALDGNRHGDYTDGAGESVVPRIGDLSQEPAWLWWPGRWGGTPAEFLGAGSPVGPLYKDEKWSDPRAWGRGSEIDTCTVTGQDGIQTQPTGSKPATPAIEATRDERMVAIEYRFAQELDATRGPWTLLTSVETESGDYPPLTERTTITEASGRITQPLGLGRSPFRVHVSLVDRRGVRSSVVTVPLR